MAKEGGTEMYKAVLTKIEISSLMKMKKKKKKNRHLIFPIFLLIAVVSFI